MVILKSLNEQILIEIEDQQDLLLGRIEQCDLVIEDTSISSQHARLTLIDNFLKVEDLESTNGTRLNYSLVTNPIYLQDGDTIEFGNVTFVVDGPTLEAPDQYASPPPALTSLEPVDKSQRPEDTMLSPDISEDELIDTTQTVIPEQADHDVDHNQPVHLAFFLALLLILLAAGVLLLNLWNLPPQF